MREEDELSLHGLVLYRKGKEIFDLVRRITDLIPEHDEYLQSIKGMMIVDAAFLTVKVAGADAVDLYDIKMQNASMIRKAGMDLMIRNHSLEMFGFKEVEYYQLVRNLIDEYRLLFIDWVASFDKTSYVPDEWGLFNPPGVGPDSKSDDL